MTKEYLINANWQVVWVPVVAFSLEWIEKELHSKSTTYVLLSNRSHPTRKRVNCKKWAHYQWDPDRSSKVEDVWWARNVKQLLIFRSLMHQWSWTVFVLHRCGTYRSGRIVGLANSIDHRIGSSQQSMCTLLIIEFRVTGDWVRGEEHIIQLLTVVAAALLPQLRLFWVFFFLAQFHTSDQMFLFFKRILWLRHSSYFDTHKIGLSHDCVTD